MNGVFAEELRPAASRVVMFRGKSGLTVDDVLSFSWFLGELQAPWHELLKAIACQESAEESELEADDEVLNSMSDAFRYERELLTVEEVERWLALRDLTEDDFSDYLMRKYWLENPPESAEAEESSYLESSTELRELLRADLLCSGKFELLARALSWRVANWPEDNQKEESANLVKAERERFLERTELDDTSLPEALKQLNRTAAWLEQCLQMEASYGRVCDSLLTEQARARTFAVMRLPLTRLKFRSLTLRSKNAAQEAALCLRENRLSLEELANECRASWETQELFLADCGSDAHQDFFSAVAGEVLAPRECEEGFVISRIEAKIEPDLADEQIRARIDRRLLESHFSELCSRNIRWVLGDPMRS